MQDSIKCEITKAFDDYEVGEVDYFTPEEVLKWERKGRIRRVERVRANRASLGVVPPSPSSGRKQVAIPQVTDNRGRRKSTGPTVTLPDGPPAEENDPEPETAPAVSPGSTQPDGPTVQKVHSMGPWYHVYVDGQPIAKDDTDEPRNFYEKDADALIADLTGGDDD